MQCLITKKIFVSIIMFCTGTQIILLEKQQLKVTQTYKKLGVEINVLPPNS